MTVSPALVLMCMTICVLLVILSQSYTFARSELHSLPCVSRQRTFYVIRNPGKFEFFTDWLSPLFRSLRLIGRVKIFSAQQFWNNEFKKVRGGDAILCVQKMHGVKSSLFPRQRLFLCNTEGAGVLHDAANAAKDGVEIIDYSPSNIEALRRKVPSVRATWVPIVEPPVVTECGVRNKICFVGGFSTARRKEFWDSLCLLGERRGMKKDVFLVITGWGKERDFASQSCAVVVNTRSKLKNDAYTRLRCDPLWLMDVTIVSEKVAETDEIEYRGTVTFVDYADLANATLHVIQHPLTAEERRKRYELKCEILAKRREQYIEALQRITAQESK